jgi:hypothetical protein
MRALGLIVILCAHAAAADPVNLLTIVPTTVAVSSTVDNAAILPEHLVDGDLATAWNSQTNELAGAWFAVRLPADVGVTSVKLTVGFTKRDKKLGDLFLENPRIKRVRVSHGKTSVEKTLDVDDRGLQTIAIAGDGGDYKIEVLEVVMGTKPSWRETCVSEFEIWGTPGAVSATKTGATTKPRPTVQLATLEPLPPVTAKDCQRAMFPDSKSKRLGDDDVIGTIDVFAAGGDRFLCHLRHGAHPDSTGDGTRTHELAAVTAKHVILGGRVQEDTHGGPQPQMAFGGSDQGFTDNTESGDVTITPFALTTGETAFEVDVTQSVQGPMTGDDETHSTLYRVTKDGLVEVLTFKSVSSGGESDDSDTCKLAVGAFPKTGKQALPDLDLHCVTRSGRFHGERPKGHEIEAIERTEHYHYNGTRYVKR